MDIQISNVTEFAILFAKVFVAIAVAVFAAAIAWVIYPGTPTVLKYLNPLNLVHGILLRLRYLKSPDNSIARRHFVEIQIYGIVIFLFGFEAANRYQPSETMPFIFAGCWLLYQLAMLYFIALLAGIQDE